MMIELHKSGLTDSQIPDQFKQSAEAREAYLYGAIDAIMGRAPSPARHFAGRYANIQYDSHCAGYAHGQRLALRTESGEQCALIEWAITMTGQYPALALLHSTPNGGERPKATGRGGKTYSPAGQRLKAEGEREGFPDLTLEYPAGQNNRLHIEMKRPGGKLTDSQERWLFALDYVGDYCAVCYSFEQARDTILIHLGLGGPELPGQLPEW